MSSLLIVLVWLVAIGFIFYQIMDTYFNKPSDEDDKDDGPWQG